MYDKTFMHDRWETTKLSLDNQRSHGILPLAKQA